MVFGFEFRILVSSGICRRRQPPARKDAGLLAGSSTSPPTTGVRVMVNIRKGKAS